MLTSAGRLLVANVCKSQLRQLPRYSVFLAAREKRMKKKLQHEQVHEPATVSDKYLAAVLKQFGESLQIQEFDTSPLRSKHDVLIDVHYCVLNPSDVLMAKNLYNFTPSLPKVLGYEIVGKVIKAGETAKESGYEEGTKVVALTMDQYGGLAELCHADFNDLWRLPSGMKLLDAASLFNTYLRALLVLESGTTVNETDILLTNVATSAIGPALVHLASHVHLGKIISVCKSEDVATLARERGSYTSLKFKEKYVLKQIHEVAAELNIKDIFDDSNNDKLKRILQPFYAPYTDKLTIKDRLYEDRFVRAVHKLSDQGRLVASGNIIDERKLETVIQELNADITIIDFRRIRAEQADAFKQAGCDVLDFYEEGFLRSGKLLIAGFNKINDVMKYILETEVPLKVIIDVKNKNAEPEFKEEEKDF